MDMDRDLNYDMTQTFPKGSFGVIMYGMFKNADWIRRYGDIVVASTKWDHGYN